MSVPKLRFKEFDGDWSLSSLSQLSTKIGDGIHATPKYDETGEIPFINGNNLIDGSVVINGNTKCISAEEFQKYNQILSDRTLFLSINGTIGNLAFYKNERVLLGKSVCFINLKNDIDKKFIYLLLQSPQLTKTFNSELTGTTIKNLSLATVRNSEFYCPREEEQTKIASFLSAVDEKTSQLNQKHELISQYKQGMMQKLFSQQIRFKADDGSEFGEWIERKIIDVADYVDYRGKTPKKVEDGTLLVTAKNIRFGYIDYSVSQEYICSDDFDEVMRRGRAEIGDVLITTEAPLGNVASVDRENIALAQRVIKYRGKKGILNNEFLKQKFLSEEFQSLISSKATGGTVQGIKGSTLHNLEIQIPQDIEEQTKIANFLSAIDQKIEVVAQQIEQAKLWKKGLLQQMFV